MADSPPSTPPMATAPPTVYQQYSLPLDYKQPREGSYVATEDVSPSHSQPVIAPVTDPLFSHFRYVLDFDTRGPVTDATALASLYRYDAGDVDKAFLRNINGKSEPCVRAQILIGEDGQYTPYPPSLDADDHYQVWIRFNTLHSAPAVRIEFRLSASDESDSLWPSPFVLEYPFNDRDGKQLRNFTCEINSGPEEPSVITFEANGATSEGLTNVDSFAHLLTSEQAKLIEMIKSQCKKRSYVRVVLSLEVLQLVGTQRHELDQVLRRLPGGGGTILPSIGHEEWSNFLSDHYSIGNVKALMETTRGIPNLMLMQDCGMTFSSKQHFCAVHETAEVIANEEGTRELRLWARADHRVTLYELRGHVVLAMKFGKPIELPSGRKLLGHPKIPNDLEIKIVLSGAGLSRDEITACHERDLMGLHRHFKYDAHFKVTSHTLEELSHLAHDANDLEPTFWHLAKLEPHENSFWINSVYKTSTALRDGPRWHDLMLGQSFASLKKVDVPAGIQDVDADQKATALKWLLGVKPWNPEQRRVIDSMHEALGGVVLCTGSGGTGKTTLLLSTAVYLVKSGGRAIVSAAENGHVENMAKVLDHIIQNVTRPDGKPINALIVQSPSRGKRLREMNAGQATLNKKGHANGGVGGLANFLFARMTPAAQRDKAWHYTLYNAVAAEATKGRLSWVTRLRDTSGREYGPAFDVWERLRELLLEVSRDTFLWTRAADRIEFQHVYNACEGYLIANADIIITTACNARCKELVQFWGQNLREHGVDVKALGVFIDNADSCRAMESWNVLTTSALPRRPDLIMLAGDIHVLGPVNTSINQYPVCNPFVASLSMSELERLVKLGFPCITLTEQRLMNTELLRFPSFAFYRNELRTAPGRDRPLDPQLYAALLRVISHKKFAYPLPATLGEKIRCCWIELSGEGKVEKNERKSIVALDHVEVFFARIFPELQDHFRDRTSKELIVIVGYAHARTKYAECLHGLQEEQGLDDAWYPRILSIDGSKGHTATMAFFDGSMKKGSQLGFLKDAKRCNVAMTRATEIFWMIGGDLHSFRDDADDEVSAFYKLRSRLVKTGQVIEFATPQLRTIDRLTAKAQPRDDGPSRTRGVALRPQRAAFGR